MAANEPISVLFLCTANSCRSQMAEAFLRHHGGERFKPLSAGLEPGTLNELAIETMQELGIDITSQQPQSIRDYLGKASIDHAIFVCQRAEDSCPHIMPFAKNQHSWPFDDPAQEMGSHEHRLHKCRIVRDQVETRICEWLREEFGIEAKPLHDDTPTL